MAEAVALGDTVVGLAVALEVADGERVGLVEEEGLVDFEGGALGVESGLAVAVGDDVTVPPSVEADTTVLPA
ncbi:hypothetical protein [Streptomyces chartreusis]|uniref:hypothetical protein n=1 Tax=Streptomyces chartreusis TaxID=1969 RepID=UPI0033F2ECCE